MCARLRECRNGLRLLDYSRKSNHRGISRGTWADGQWVTELMILIVLIVVDYDRRSEDRTQRIWGGSVIGTCVLSTVTIRATRVLASKLFSVLPSVQARCCVMCAVVSYLFMPNKTSTRVH